jgi:hypothetical protein
MKVIQTQNTGKNIFREGAHLTLEGCYTLGSTVTEMFITIVDDAPGCRTIFV